MSINSSKKWAVAVGWTLVVVSLFLFAIVIGQVFIAPKAIYAIRSVSENYRLSEAIEHFVYLIVGFSPALILLLLYVGLTQKEPLSSILGSLKFTDAVIGITIGFLVSFVPLLLITLASRMLPHMTVGATSSVVITISLFLGAFCLGFQSFTEEVVFRGWLLPKLQPLVGSWSAILLSSLGFALAHSLNPNITIAQIAGLVSTGVILGILTLWTRSVWCAGFAHTLWNWTQVQLFAPADANVKTVVLFAGAPLHGAELESQTSFLVVSILLLIALIVSYRFILKRSQYSAS